VNQFNTVQAVGVFHHRLHEQLRRGGGGVDKHAIAGLDGGNRGFGRNEFYHAAKMQKDGVPASVLWMKLLF
jgi:hypothetical protein